MSDHDDEPTGEVLAMTDAQLLAAHRARQRLLADMDRAIDAAFEPNEQEEST